MTTVMVNEQLLDEKLAEIEKGRPWSVRVIAKLEAAIRTAEDYALFRINPMKYAAEKGMNENEAVDLFLFGTKQGLFEMEWHLVCAYCAQIFDSLRELSRLHTHFVCDFCRAENEASLDDYIQVTFTISRQVRPIAF